jgi:hypothetical protein
MLKLGVAAGGVMTYAAFATALAESFVAVAIAVMVSVEVTTIAVEYLAEAVVGVVPLVV